MVYKLDEADKLCGITYIDWSKKYSKIPKATCEMIQPKCSSGGGVSYDDAVELKCEDLKKLIHGEENPKEEEKPKEDKPTTDEVTPKENEPSPSPKVDENPTEHTPEPPVTDTPTEGNASDHLGDVPSENNSEVNLLELMPTIEDKFSEVIYSPDGIVRSVVHNTPEEKVAFENKIITTLKSKLPEGAVVEAVLGEPYYKEGSEYLKDKTNYTLSVRVTIKGKVYEQEYNVPHIVRPIVGIIDNI